MENLEEKDLKEQINYAREKLYKCIEKYGSLSEKTIEQSHKLDDLICLDHTT